MSLLPVSNTAEGGSDTTVVSAANSGGASGTAFDSVTNPSSIMTFSSTQEHAGSLALRTAQPGVAVSTYGVWNGWGSLTTSIYTRLYFYVSAVNVANLILGWRSNTDAAAGYMGINATGKIVMQNAAGTAVSTSTTTISANTWYRLETRIQASTTVGQVEWRLYTGANLDGTTTTEAPAAVTNAVLTANIAGVRIGPAGITSGGAATNITGYLDDIGINNTTWLGPSAATASSRFLGLLGVGA